MKKIGLAIAAVALAASPGVAQQVTSTQGTIVTYNNIEHQVTGSMMGGMKVSAAFANGTSLFGLWNDLGGGYWGVDLYSGQTRYIRVRVGSNEDTFGGDWRVDLYQYSDLRTLTFEGGPQYGNIIFDRVSNSGCVSSCSSGSRGNTTQTSTGVDFNIFNASNDGYSSGYESVDARYTDIVRYGNESLKWDAFTKVTVDFSDFSWSDGPDKDNSPFYFNMDTDKALVAPEPSTYALMAAGLSVLGAMARRRRTAA